MSHMLFRRSGNSTYKKVIAFLAILMLMPVQGISQEQERQITEIQVVGNEHVTDEAVMAAIALKPGAAYSEDAIQEAKQAIESMGYFQPGVTVGVESVDGGSRVIFHVVENPVVKEIQITGNTVMETDTLLSLMRTSVGTVLNLNTLRNQDIPAIERQYTEQGYYAFVTEEIGIDPQTGVLKVPITEVTIEEIEITGNKKTKDFVITRELTLEPGDVYNEFAMARDLQRIYDLGIFERESAGLEKDIGSDLDKIKITIPVKEAKTGEVSVGLGYSSKQKLVGQARLSESNLFGRAQQANILWEQSSDRGSSWELGWFEPWLDSKHTSLGINVYDKLLFRFSNSFFGTSGSSDTDYDERRKGGSITLSRPFSISNRGFVTFRTEEVDTGISALNSPLSSDGRVTSGTLRFTSDVRDSSVDPFRGGYNSYALEVGDANFTALSNNEENTLFTKYSVDLRRYFSKGGPRKEIDEQRKRLAVRLMAGSLTGTVPFFEQYFVGGAESLRGFKEDRFWGKNMLLLSTEYRFPVAKSLTGVVFVDAGDAWGAPDDFRTTTETVDGVTETVDLIDDYPQHENFDLNVGYGVGIRVVTPLGPLRLDYGFSSEGSRAHFSIGHAF